MSLFVSFKYKLTYKATSWCEEDFGSEIYEDKEFQKPYNAETLRILENKIKDSILKETEGYSVLITILDWKEIEVAKKQYSKYVVAPTSTVYDTDDPIYNQNLFGCVGRKIPEKGEFVFQNSNSTMYRSEGKNNENEEEVWHLISVEDIKDITIA